MWIWPYLRFNLAPFLCQCLELDFHQLLSLSFLFRYLSDQRCTPPPPLYHIGNPFFCSWKPQKTTWYSKNSFKSCRKLCESLAVSYQVVLEKLQIRKDVMMENPRKQFDIQRKKKEVHNFFSCRRLCESLIVFLSIG